jgi:hypothetical protein
VPSENELTSEGDQNINFVIHAKDCHSIHGFITLRS